ncbi:MAG TPA: hypothetical protein VIJ00_14155 [Nakamurella sp.]
MPATIWAPAWTRRRVFTMIRGSLLNTAGGGAATRYRSEPDGGPDGDVPLHNQLDQITRLVDALGRPETDMFHAVDTGFDGISDGLRTVRVGGDDQPMPVRLLDGCA